MLSYRTITKETKELDVDEHVKEESKLSDDVSPPIKCKWLQ